MLQYSGKPMVTINENEEIAKSIFSHLLMFQYLEDLKKHHLQVLSIFKSVHKVSFSENLRVDFLIKWSKERNVAVEHAEDWTFSTEEDPITKHKFVEKWECLRLDGKMKVEGPTCQRCSTEIDSPVR